VRRREKGGFRPSIGTLEREGRWESNEQENACLKEAERLSSKKEKVGEHQSLSSEWRGGTGERKGEKKSPLEKGIPTTS